MEILRICFPAILIAVILLLSGCGGGDSSDKNDSDKSSAASGSWNEMVWNEHNWN